MGFRFRKSIKILPGLKINLSKSGVSTSIGGRGASVNVGKRGVRSTVGIPGSGLSYSSLVSTPKTKTPQSVPSMQSNEKPETTSRPFAQLQPPKTGKKKSNFSPLQIVVLVTGGLFTFCLLCITGFLIVGGITPSRPTPTAIVKSISLEQMVAMTANEAQTQTQTAASPTLQPLYTTTYTPTVTMLANGDIFQLQTNVAMTEIVYYTSTPGPPIIYISPPPAYSTNPPSSHPPGTTGLCNDGTYTKAQHSQGACSSHGGLAAWWGP